MVLDAWHELSEWKYIFFIQSNFTTSTNDTGAEVMTDNREKTQTERRENRYIGGELEKWTAPTEADAKKKAERERGWAQNGIYTRVRNGELWKGIAWNIALTAEEKRRKLIELKKGWDGYQNKETKKAQKEVWMLRSEGRSKKKSKNMWNHESITITFYGPTKGIIIASSIFTSGISTSSFLAPSRLWLNTYTDKKFSFYFCSFSFIQRLREKQSQKITSNIVSHTRKHLTGIQQYTTTFLDE